VNEVGQVATVVQDHVQWLTVGEDDGLKMKMKFNF
jgi:hypothetical protein